MDGIFTIRTLDMTERAHGHASGTDMKDLLSGVRTSTVHLWIGWEVYSIARSGVDGLE